MPERGISLDIFVPEGADSCKAPISCDKENGAVSSFGETAPLASRADY